MEMLFIVIELEIYKMRNLMLKRIVVFISTLTAAFFFSPACRADVVTIIGEVNDAQQIVADNQLYEVADNALGDDLVYNYISEKVKVTGSVEERDDMKIITVMSFEVVPE
jgi:hypothetical protein